MVFGLSCFSPNAGKLCSVRLSEGLGITVWAATCAEFAPVRSTVALLQPRLGVALLEIDMKLTVVVEIEYLPSGLFECRVSPAGVVPAEAWGTGGEGRTMSESFMKAAWGFERLEEANPLALNTGYPELLRNIQSASEFSPWRPPRWMIQHQRETQL